MFFPTLFWDYQRYHESGGHRLPQYHGRPDTEHTEYSEKRQKLEYEAMTRNPETAYLVDNEEYERQIEDWDGRLRI